MVSISSGHQRHVYHSLIILLVWLVRNSFIILFPAFSFSLLVLPFDIIWPLAGPIIVPLAFTSCYVSLPTWPRRLFYPNWEWERQKDASSSKIRVCDSNWIEKNEKINKTSPLTAHCKHRLRKCLSLSQWMCVWPLNLWLLLLQFTCLLWLLVVLILWSLTSAASNITVFLSDAHSVAVVFAERKTRVESDMQRLPLTLEFASGLASHLTLFLPLHHSNHHGWLEKH